MKTHITKHTKMCEQFEFLPFVAFIPMLFGGFWLWATNFFRYGSNPVTRNKCSFCVSKMCGQRQSLGIQFILSAFQIDFHSSIRLIRSFPFIIVDSRMANSWNIVLSPRNRYLDMFMYNISKEENKNYAEVQLSGTHVIVSFGF